MLSIASVSSQHAAHYYGADNYCSLDEAKTASQWTGNGCDALQLGGPVENQVFSTLLNGYTPDGKPLHQAFKMHHVAGIDLTFSTPKSISLATLWHGAVDLFNAHYQAVKTALALIESQSGARRWDGQRVFFERTENLIIAQFAHTTSRAQDPQLHTHNVVLNTTQTDQDWRALDARTLFKHRKLWQTVYHQDLAINAQQLGYAVKRYQGHLELAGYTPEQLDYWSKRRQQILQAVGHHASRAQKQIACLRTRPKKQGHRSLESLRQQWDTENQQMGLGIEHPQPHLSQTSDAAHRLDAAKTALEHLTQSLGLTETLDTLTLIQQVFGDDGWGNPDQPFGYRDLAQAITDAKADGHLYEQNGHLCRSAHIPISAPNQPTQTLITPYPYTDAVGQFAHAIAQNKRALLIAPAELHDRLTQAIRQRLKQLGTLNSPQTALQQTSTKPIEVTICSGDRLRIPGRVGPVHVQVEAIDRPRWVQLRHRNGKVTAWDLEHPKVFEFAWVHTGETLPKQHIDEIHLVGNIGDQRLNQLRKKVHVPITVYQLDTQREPKVITAPNLDRGLELDR
ncbi:conjugative relaxase domain protein, TrwC/TraI family [Leptolyngbya sp. PCC 7375]|nr:conjugative relaxase domain protein, TrwC/TraI family [Leptolyngbya sp. PCC 7375]